MDEPKDRLQKARKDAGYDTPTDAANAFGWGSTYLSHENGSRGIRTAMARRYGKAFRVKPAWILTGDGPAPEKRTEGRTVPLLGYVGAGAVADFFPITDAGDTAPAPPDVTDQTVAVEVRGSSLGPAFDRWLIYYDNVQRSVTERLYHQLCVVGLRDGRTMVKIVQPSKTKGLYHLISNTAESPPILDAQVVWAARVIHMAPRR